MALGASAGPPTNVTVVLEKDEAQGMYTKEIWAMVTQEARAVSLWALLTPLLRLAFQPLISQACVGAGEMCPSSNLSALAGWLLSVFPRSVAQKMAPGFLFASAWYVEEGS